MCPFRHRHEDRVRETTLSLTCVEERIETEHAVWRYLVRLLAYAPLLQILTSKFWCGWGILHRYDRTFERHTSHRGPSNASCGDIDMSSAMERMYARLLRGE